MRVITLKDKDNVEHQLVDAVSPELWAKRENDVLGQDAWHYEGIVVFCRRQDNRALLKVTTVRGDSQWRVFWYIGTEELA